MTETTLSLLIKGREYLARPGVSLEQSGEYFGHLDVMDAEGEYLADRSKCCGVGAIVAATGCVRAYDLAGQTGVSSTEMAAVLRRHLPATSSARTFFDFNDAAASKDEVLAVFDAAITTLAAQAAS